LPGGRVAPQGRVCRGSGWLAPSVERAAEYHLGTCLSSTSGAWQSWPDRPRTGVGEVADGVRWWRSTVPGRYGTDPDYRPGEHIVSHPTTEELRPSVAPAILTGGSNLIVRTIERFHPHREMAGPSSRNRMGNHSVPCWHIPVDRYLARFAVYLCVAPFERPRAVRLLQLRCTSRGNRGSGHSACSDDFERRDARASAQSGRLCRSGVFRTGSIAVPGVVELLATSVEST